MTTANDARRAHELLDELDARAELSQEQEKLLRSFLPELPKQKTLEEILEEVESAACSVTDSYWSPSLNPQDWLWELHSQMKGLKDTPATVPALPDGMRIAVHAVYGRVVVSPVVDDDGTCKIFHLSTHARDGSDYCWAPIDSLTFIDYEPAKYDHPEFLETEADYHHAPEGTIVACDDTETVWLKRFGAWKSTDGDHGVTCVGLSASRLRVLRWGWSK